MANEIEIKITVQDQSGNTIELANDKLDEMARNLADLADKEKKVTDKTKDTAQGFKLLDGVMLSLGNKAVDFISQLPRMTVELVKFGAEVQQQRIATDALAASFGTTGDAIIESIQDASQYTISQMGAMQAANKAMVLDVATTPEAFSRLAKVATELGKAMGQDATKSIDDFVTAAGRQSKQIADNLGLMVSAEDANKRYAESIGKTADELTDAEKKQAFLNEMLRQGEAKLGDLGDTSDSAAVKMAKLSAAAEDAKSGFAELAASALDAIGSVDGLAARIRGMPDAVKNIMMMRQAFQDAAFAAQKGINPIEAWNASLKRQVVALDDSNTEIQHYSNIQKDIPKIVDDSADAFSQYTQAIENTQKAHDDELGTIRKVQYASYDVRKELKENVKTQAQLEAIVANATYKLEQEAKAQAELARVTQATNEMILDQGMAFTDFFRDVEVAEADHNKTLEELKAEHFANVAELEKRGQSYAIQINEQAEQEKLAALQQRLDLALVQQSEFTDKTKESTRMSKEAQIAELQEQVSTQTQLLDDYYNGRLVAQGENVSSLLEAENQRYLDEIALQQEQQAIIEEEQRQSLGRMVLEAFDAWATMKGIPPGQMLEMRTALAEEYNLVEEGSTDLMKNVVASFEEMASGTGKTTGEIVADVANATDAMLNLKRGIDDLPTSKSINIDVKVNQRSVGFGGSTMQDMGADLAAGLSVGIENGTPGVVQSVDDMTSAMMGSAAEGLGVQSPSKYTRKMAYDVVDGFIIGMDAKSKEVKEKIDETIVDPLESAFDISSKFESVGNTASRMIEEKYLNPLKDALGDVQDQSKDLQKEYEDLGEFIGGDSLEKLNEKLEDAIKKQEKFNDKTSEDTRLDQEEKIAEIRQEISDEQQALEDAANRRLAIEREMTTLGEQGLAINEKVAEQEKRIADYKQAQQNLDFLKQQLDLVKLIQETGTDPSILRDFQFGLGASLEDLVDITTGVLEDVTGRVSSELAGIQSGAGFISEMFPGMGMNDMNVGNIGDQLSSFLSSVFNTPGSSVTNNTASNSANFGDVSINNGMDMATFMAMLNTAFTQVTI